MKTRLVATFVGVLARFFIQAQTTLRLHIHTVAYGRAIIGLRVSAGGRHQLELADNLFYAQEIEIARHEHWADAVPFPLTEGLTQNASC